MEVHLSSDKNIYIIKEHSHNKFLCSKELFEKIKTKSRECLTVADLTITIEQAKELYRQLRHQLKDLPF